MRIEREGVGLWIEEAGHGEPPVLLVHGWTCDHTFLDPQREHLARRHRVVAVDLRGHGRSDAPEGDYSMALLADDLAGICRALGLDRPVVIGHSLGGVVAVELAARHPAVLRAVVTLDAPLVPSAAMRARVAPFLEALGGAGFREAQRAFVSEALFAPADDRDRKARIVDTMTRAPRHVTVSAFREMIACDTAAALAACRVPLLYLYAAKPASDLARLRALCPHVVTGQTVGAGHFHQLEVPEQVNAMIDRFLTLIAAHPEEIRTMHTRLDAQGDRR